MSWSVYIILCSDNTLYTGITVDVDRRFRQHASRKGAKYFRGRQPLRTVFVEDGHTKATASRREAAIKKLSRHQKMMLVTDFGGKR